MLRLPRCDEQDAQDSAPTSLLTENCSTGEVLKGASMSQRVPKKAAFPQNSVRSLRKMLITLSSTQMRADSETLTNALLC